MSDPKTTEKDAREMTREERTIFNQGAREERKRCRQIIASGKKLDAVDLAEMLAFGTAFTVEDCKALMRLANENKAAFEAERSSS